MEMVWQFPLGFHVLRVYSKVRKKWTLLDEKLGNHFVITKHYQHHINLCQHLKWQTSCHGTNIQIQHQISDLIKAIEAEQTLDSIQALFQLDYKK